MKFRTYYESLSPEGKRELAKKLDTSVPYLYQLSVGIRNAGAKFLLGIEDATGGAVSPRDIRDPSKAGNASISR